MVRVAITFVFALMVSATAWAGNWNSDKKASAGDYMTYSKLPCSFNGVQVGNSGYPPRDHDQSYKQKLGRCVKERINPIFYSKDGTSINAPYGSPVVAIADMDFYYGLDFSSEYRCIEKWYKKGFTTKGAGKFDHKVRDPANPNSTRQCQKPYDGVELVFKVKSTGELVKYYHLSSSPIVPGFGSGDCKKPLMKDRVVRHTRYPEDCGGVAIKSVKKGEVVGYVGAVGNANHIGINIFRNGRWLIAPEDHTKWESSPKNPDYFLLPVIQNPNFADENSSSESIIFYDELMGGLKETILQILRRDDVLRNCVLEHSNIKKGTLERFYEHESAKLVLYHTVTSRCFAEWKAKDIFLQAEESESVVKESHKILIRKAIRTDVKFRKCLSQTHIGPDRVNTAVLRNMSETAMWVVEEAANTACFKTLE